MVLPYIQSHFSRRKTVKNFDLRIPMEKTGRIIGYILAGLILIIALSFALACGDDSTTRVIVTDPSGPVPEEPIPPAENEAVQLALTTSTSIKFYDGKTIWTWKTGNVRRAGSGAYSSENILYMLNEFGQTVSSKALVAVPDTITLDGSDVWITENIDPETAYAAGALYKDYTRVYKNSAEVGTWYDRQYKTECITVLDGNAWGRTDAGTWKHLNGVKSVRMVVPDDFAITDYNSTTKTALINGIPVSWTLNFFNGANYWLNGYSQNGYRWDGSNLTETGLVMAELRAVQNIIISAGTRFENGEDVLYWINCATGWVIRHVPSTNQSTDHVRLYTGDGTTEEGLYYKPILKPVIVGDNLYFQFDAQFYRYNFVTGLTAHFTSGVSEIIEY